MSIGQMLRYVNEACRKYYKLMINNYFFSRIFSKISKDLSINKVETFASNKVAKVDLKYTMQADRFLGRQ